MFSCGHFKYIAMGTKPPLVAAAGLFEAHCFFEMTPGQGSIVARRIGLRQVSAHHHRGNNWRVVRRTGVGTVARRVRRAPTTPVPLAQRPA